VIIVDVWFLIMIQWLIFDIHVPLISLYIVRFKTNVAGFAFNVLHLFFVFLSFLGFDPFFIYIKNCFYVFCKFNLFWVLVFFFCLTRDLWFNLWSNQKFWAKPNIFGQPDRVKSGLDVYGAIWFLTFFIKEFLA